MTPPIARLLGAALMRTVVIKCNAPLRSERCRRELLLDDQVPHSPFVGAIDRAKLQARAIAAAGWFLVAGTTMCAHCYAEAVDSEDLDDGVVIATEVDRRALLQIEVRP